MANRPTAAFVLSIIGGILTIGAASISISTWSALNESLGPGFRYSSLGLGDVASGEAIVLFVLGVVCGIMILVGAYLLYSGRRRRVWTGALVILAATVVGIPTTYFGMVLGGLLSTAGGVMAISWKSPEAPAPSGRTKTEETESQVLPV